MPFTQKDQDAEDYLLSGTTPSATDGQYDVSTGDSSTARGAPPAPPMPAMPPSPPAGPVFNPQAGAPPPPPPPMPPPAAPLASPPQNNDLSDFFAQQKAGMQKYGPEQQMAVEQAILKSRGGLRANVANAGAGFADALMQGVARAGPSNFQQNLQARTDKTEEGMRSAMEKAQTGKMAQLTAQNELMKNDPTSPLSKIAQKANASTLIAAGVPKEAIPAMPAGLISEIGSKNVTLLDDRIKMQLESAYRMAGLDLQAQQIRATIANQKAERQFGAAKELAGQGGLKKFTNLLSPTGRASQNMLASQAAGSPEPPTPVNSPAEYQALPSGTHYVDSKGNHGVKK